jgi:hypothetical protein
MSKQNSQTSSSTPNNGKNESTPKTTPQIQPVDPKLKPQTLLRISPQLSQTWNPVQSQPIYGSFPPQIQNRTPVPPPSTKTIPFQQPQGNVYQQQNYSKFRTVPSGTMNNPSNLQTLQNIPSYKVQDPKNFPNKVNVAPQLFPTTTTQNNSTTPPPPPPKIYQIPNKYPYQKSTTYQQFFQKPNLTPNHHQYNPNSNMIQQGQLYTQPYMMNSQQNVYRNTYPGVPQQMVYQSQPNQVSSIQNNFPTGKPLEPKKKTNKKKRLVLDPDEEDLDIFDDEESEEEFDDPNDKDFETKKIAPKPQAPSLEPLEKSSSEEASEEEVDFEKIEEKNQKFLNKFSQDFDSNRNLRTKKKTDYGLETSSEESNEDSEQDSDQKTTSELIEEEDEEIIEFVLNHRNKESEVLIKWKGWANIHNTWNSVDELIHHKGFKKVENYLKKVKEIENWKKTATPEEIEHHQVYEQLDFDLHEDYKKIERIIGKRPARHAKNFVNSKQEEGLNEEEF